MDYRTGFLKWIINVLEYRIEARKIKGGFYIEVSDKNTGAIYGI